MKSKIPKIHDGDIVQIVFWDHCSGDATLKSPIKFEVFGRIRTHSNIGVVIDSWTHTKDELDDNEKNVESFAIVRSAIIDLKILKKFKK